MSALTPKQRETLTEITDVGDNAIEVCFDLAHDHVASLTIYRDGTVGWSALIGQRNGYGRGPLPAWVRSAMLAPPIERTSPDLVALVQEWQAAMRETFPAGLEDVAWSDERTKLAEMALLGWTPQQTETKS